MSKKNPDRRGRLRSIVVAFRVSKEESDQINEAVALSGLTKQDYIIKKLSDRTVTVAKSPRTYKALKVYMERILSELHRIRDSSECSEEFLDTIRYVTEILDFSLLCQETSVSVESIFCHIKTMLSIGISCRDLLGMLHNRCTVICVCNAFESNAKFCHHFSRSFDMPYISIVRELSQATHAVIVEGIEIPGNLIAKIQIIH